MSLIVSVIIPCYRRVEQTLKTISLILGSDTSQERINLEVIVADSSPDSALKDSLKKNFNNRVIYTRPLSPGIATNKNQGARIANGSILIFCDSDIEIDKKTIFDTVFALKRCRTAGAIGGKVVWKGGDQHGTTDRPRKEDRMLRINGATYIEAIYSRYMSTFRDIFWKVGGYDETVFNMRGEGSDLSIRYWRSGYPLVYEPSIRIYHLHDVSDSAALRVEHPEWGIAKDFFLLAYKYDMFGDEYANFSKTIAANFNQFGEKACYRLLQGIAKYVDFIKKAREDIDRQKKVKPRFDFKFLEIFSEKELFNKCISQAENFLLETRKRTFGL